MTYFESIVTVLLKKDIYFQEVQEFIGKFLNKTMLNDEELKTIHKAKGAKNYTFDSLSPVELTTKVYKTGNIYVFRIRSLSQRFLKKMERCMKMNQSKQLDVIAVEQRTYRDKIIDSVYTLTPVIVTVNNQPWMQEDDLDLFIRRLEDNAEKKMKALSREEVNHFHFIEGIEFTNSKPVPVTYKGITLLGHKIRVKIKTDSESQKLAHVVLGAGMGEKNSSIGAGYCLANFI